MSPGTKGKKMEEEIYDVGIIGGGPGGLTAALYCCRDQMKTILFEPMLMGGMVNEATLIENYPGFPAGINGYDLSSKIYDQAVSFGMKSEMAEVTAVKKTDNLFDVETTDNHFLCKTVIVATGSAKNKLNIPGEQELKGLGVSYCATCDAPFFRDKVIAVVGGGNTALMEAMHLAKFGSKVYLIHRRNEFRATKLVADRIAQEPKIETQLGYTVERIEGSEKVQDIVLVNKLDGSKKTLAVDAVFVAVGITPNSKCVEDLVHLSTDGSIITDVNMETSVPGVYAVGDVRTNSIKQVISACGDGATAAVSIKNKLS